MNLEYETLALRVGDLTLQVMSLQQENRRLTGELAKLQAPSGDLPKGE